MKIIYYTFRDINTASSRLRCFNIAKELFLMNHSVIINPLPTEPREADVLVVQKRFDPSLFEGDYKLRVFDIDDNYFEDPDIKEKAWQMVDLADIVTVSTPFLATYIPMARIVPTPLDITKKVFKRDYDIKGIIGWVGGWENQKYLTPILPIAKDLGFKLKVISNSQKVFDGTVEYRAWNLNTNDRELIECDFGISPLDSSLWCRAKSAVKPLKYFGLGLPVIASPNPEYERIEEDIRVPFIARDLKQWWDALQMAKFDRALQAMNGMDYAWQHYTPEKIASIFLDIIIEEAAQRDLNL